MKRISRSLILFLAILLLGVFAHQAAYPQSTTFGKNKVQYKNFDWYFIQSSHFDVYFSQGGESIAEYTADIAESSYASISKSFRYQITNRIPVVVYNSHNDFQQTNVVNTYLEEGIGGVTELFKNRVVLPFEGDYGKFRHVIHHELVHAVLNDMFYGGSIQSIISNNITLQLPTWFNEGLAEFEALRWETNSDMFLRDATVHEYLPQIPMLEGYYAYRGGQSVWNYITTKYGDQKVAEILSRIRGTRSVDQGFRSAIGLSVEELSERWQKEQKVLYWPDIAKRQEPADYARRLTDHKKDGSFYNTSPVISPDGSKIAFISNRDDYFDVFLMNAVDGSIQKKLVSGQRTADFEELHLLTPGMSFSADGRWLALATKSGKEDAVILLNTESGEERKMEFGLDGIFSVDWGPPLDDTSTGPGRLTFIGLVNGRSDVYMYDLQKQELTNLTNDIFSDADPVWSTDGRSIFFTSDRGNYLRPQDVPVRFKMQHYDNRQFNLYRIDIATGVTTRVNDMPMSSESSPAVLHDGKHILFVSDLNGINNIYAENLDSGTVRPLTNSLSGVYQLSVCRDGSKLIFASLNNGGFDLFLMRNPLDRELSPLEPTEFYKRLSARNERTDTALSPRKAVAVNDSILVKIDTPDTNQAFGDEVKIDLRNYVFNDAFRETREKTPDSVKLAPMANNVDSSGNYKVNKYKLNFSPDIVYGNAGYNTFYGIQGSTIMAFSDMLGNHQIYILMDLQFDLKNSDYALAYFAMPTRVDYGFEAFHSARFLLLTDSNGVDNVFRFRNYGLTGIASYPIDRFNRWELSLSWFNISKENLDSTYLPAQRRVVVVPSLSYIHDNSLWGLIAPDNGERYNLTLMASPRLGDESLGFYTLTADYRRYIRLGRNYTLAFRLAGGGSFGQDPQRFIVGGVDNWINRQFEGDRIPIQDAEDFVFLTTGIPLRGYNFNARIGTKYGLMNLELRFPLLGYFAAGPLPVLLQSFSGALFLDMGGAWTHRSDFKAFDRDPVTNSLYMRDLLTGTGYGVRMIFLGFLLKLDVAWAFNLQDFSTPKYYFSLGADI